MYYGSKLFGVVNNSLLATFGNGLIYNGYASLLDLLPSGFRIPNPTDVNLLISNLGGGSIGGGSAKAVRTNISPGWTTPNTGATNSSGFTAVGAGYRQANGIFTSLNIRLQFWRNDLYRVIRIFNNSTIIDINTLSARDGNSIRGIMINTSDWYEGMIVNDYDGNKYTTIKIGTQVWMQSNLKTTHLNDGTQIPNVTENLAWAALTTPGQCTYNNAAISEYTELITL